MKGEITMIINLLWRFCMIDKKIKLLFGFLIISILSIFFSASVKADIYYVDQSHSNSSDSWKSNENDEGHPWKTIEHATHQVVAGDTVLVKSGTYTPPGTGDREEPALEPVNSGTAGNYITFQAYSGDTVTIQCDESSKSCPFVIGGVSRSYIMWDGLTVDTSASSTRGGAAIIGGSSAYVTIQNCDFIGHVCAQQDQHDGIALQADDITIKNTKVHGWKAAGSNGGGIKLFNCTDTLIENCELYDNRRGVGDKEEGVNTTIRYCLFHDNTNEAIMIMSQDGLSGSGARIHNNIFYDNGADYCIKNNVSGSEMLDDFSFYNNTMVDSGGVRHLQDTNFQFWNNIIYDSGTMLNLMGQYGYPAYSDYNCFYTGQTFTVYEYYNERTYTSLSSWQSGEGFDTHSIHQDPLFVNYGSKDFHLQEQSLCTSTGIDRQDYDKDGNKTERINMGCYITGNEIIGPISQSGDTTPPAPPTGLIIVE